MNKDEQHLQLLSIFQYIFAALTAMFSMLPVIHLLVGLGLASGAFMPSTGEYPVERMIGMFFVMFAAVLISCGLALAAAAGFAGRCLGRRTHYTYCMVVAAAECLFVPIGTVLGVFTIIVLSRPTVKAMFQSGTGSAASG